MRASIAAERAGIPTVSIIAEPFRALAEAVAAAEGFDSWPIAYFPGVVMTLSDSEFQDAVDDVLVPRVLEAMATPPRRIGGTEVPEPRQIVVRGDLDAVQEHFHRRSWSDGLPVTPPTLDRVDAFLRFTDLPPDHVIGVLPADMREATVWSVAVNGVMAGCYPEHMPLLVAVVEAIADPDFHLEDAGSTPGWEPMVIVNGPLARHLDFNASTGALRVGRHSNTSLGRFVRMYMRNVGGWRIPPAETDKGTIGQTFNVALAEDEEAVRAMGWPTFAEERGFAAGDSVVTVQSTIASTPAIYTEGDAAITHVQVINDVFGQRVCGYWVFTGYLFESWAPLLVMSSSVARVLARDGWSKDDLRHYLRENSWESFDRMCDVYAPPTGVTLLREMVSPELRAALSDDQGRLPVFHYPEQIGIVVAGDPGRNQSRGYVNSHRQGHPVSRAVRLPADWDARLAEVRGHRESRLRGEPPPASGA